MFTLDFSLFTLIYITVGISSVFILWFYYDHRDKVLYDRERIQASFHCVRCGKLYTARTVDRAVTCPGCGFSNSRLKF